MTTHGCEAFIFRHGRLFPLRKIPALESNFLKD
jgi:hypothetical protein